MTIQLSQFPAIESLVFEMRSYQEPSDRWGYIDIATEAIFGNRDKGNRGKFINILYHDILKHGDMDFGKIGASKGNLTKYVHYSKLNDAFDCLMNICNGDVKSSEALSLFKELRDVLIDARSDFEMGYKLNIEIIQLTYKSLVLALHYLISTAISDVTDYLREACAVGKRTSKPEPYLINHNVRQFIRAYNNGEWATMIKGFKGQGEEFFGTVALVGAGIIAAIITVFSIIRVIIYTFYYSKTKLSDYASHEAKLLKHYMQLNYEENPDIANKQKKMLAFLEGEKELIDYEHARAENNAEHALISSNKTSFSSNALEDPKSTTSDGFQLI